MCELLVIEEKKKKSGKLLLSSTTIELNDGPNKSIANEHVRV